MNSDGAADGKDIEFFLSAMFGEPVTGACCDEFGLCVEVEQIDCVGTYQGHYSCCDDLMCPAPGACCYYAGGCAEVLEVDCVGGEFQGDGTTCAGGCPTFPAPVVSQAMFDENPVAACTGTVVSVTITGTDFFEGATAILVMAGESDIAGVNAVVASDTMITVDFDLTGAAAGNWAVVVINPDMQQSGESLETLTAEPCSEGACCIVPINLCIGVVPAAECVGGGIQYQGDGTTCESSPCGG